MGCVHLSPVALPLGQPADPAKTLKDRGVGLGRGREEVTVVKLGGFPLGGKAVGVATGLEVDFAHAFRRFGAQLDAAGAALALKA